jgi:hypothetical protein
MDRDGGLAAMPLYLRKSSAFPLGSPTNSRGYAALFAEKLCFSVKFAHQFARLRRRSPLDITMIG